jgi:hypothetical protein
MQQSGLRPDGVCDEEKAFIEIGTEELSDSSILLWD